MSDGWETARRLDRPEVLETYDDGTLKVSGKLNLYYILNYLILFSLQSKINKIKTICKINRFD